MSRASPKIVLFTQLAAVAKSVAHPHRLELLEQLAQGNRSVELLAQRTGLSVANASQHLQHLRRAGIINSSREGKFVYYALADETLLDLLAALRRVAERNSAEVQRVLRTYFEDRDSMQAVTREELLEKMRIGSVTVLDVRPADEFALGHLPHAINVPLPQLEARMAEFDPKQEIVAYCRGAYCVLSFEAVAALRSRGFKVRRLEDGLPEWRAAGLPVVVSSEQSTDPRMLQRSAKTKASPAKPSSRSRTGRHRAGNQQRRTA
jgi:rhodanese-related sulfurtransferase/DNA-binding transcriptional ArsR family regulator